jgi:O-antigen ligase
MEKKLIFFNSLLIYFIPLGLVTGPFIPDLFVTISAISYIFLIVKNKASLYLNNKLIQFFLFFYLYFLIGSLFSEDIYLSTKSSIFYFRFFLFFLMVSFLIENNQKFIILFFYSLLLTMILVTFDGYFQFIFKFNLLGFEKLNDHRISGFFRDELIIGSYLSRLLPLLIGLFIINYQAKSTLVKIIFGVFVLLVFGLIFLSGERAAFFLSFLSLFVIIILYNSKLIYKFYVVLTLLSLILTYSIINPHVVDRVYNQTYAQINALVFSISDKEDERLTKHVKNKDILRFVASNQHGQHFETAINMFLSKPFTGYGVKMFREICKKPNFDINTYSCTNHPHNSYMQLLAEGGIIGVFYLVIPFFITIYLLSKQLYFSFLKKKFINDYHISLLACILITLWPLTTTGNLFNNWLSIIYFLPVGFLFRTIK